MDYCLCKAYSYGDLSEAEFIVFGYDVNCQFCVNHPARIERNSDWIHHPEGLEGKIYYVIGTFHVHGHRPECFHRYATYFLKHAGWRSAEILEVRWSVLNKAASSLRYMTIPHMFEMLDALMNDINWKTMVGIGGSHPNPSVSTV